MTASPIKKDYTHPRIAACQSLPDLLCDSGTLDGGLEDLTEEEWTL